jgi:hypothetical protein
MTVISRPVTLYLGGPFVVDAELRYDTTDQLAVSLVPQDADGGDNPWQFARSLLADGLKADAHVVGAGGVAFHRHGPRLVIRLRAGGVCGEAWMHAAEVRAFLRDTYRLVPAGAEVVDFGAELDAIVAGGAR